MSDWQLPQTGSNEWRVHANSNNGKRWKVVIAYKDSITTHEIDEISELAAIIENGPDWYTLDRCIITLAQRP